MVGFSLVVTINRFMSESDIDEVVARFYHELGGPGSFAGVRKLYLALKANKYRFS